MGNIEKLLVDGTLDLHTFHPSDVKALIPDYLIECQKIGIYDVRIIHGKGTGVLRGIVHSVLSELSYVAHFQLAGESEGAWGATLVTLKRIASP